MPTSGKTREVKSIILNAIRREYGGLKELRGLPGREAIKRISAALNEDEVARIRDNGITWSSLERILSSITKNHSINKAELRDYYNRGRHKPVSAIDAIMMEWEKHQSTKTQGNERKTEVYNDWVELTDKLRTKYKRISEPELIIEIAKSGKHKTLGETELIQLILSMKRDLGVDSADRYTAMAIKRLAERGVMPTEENVEKLERVIDTTSEIKVRRKLLEVVRYHIRSKYKNLITDIKKVIHEDIPKNHQIARAIYKKGYHKKLSKEELHKILRYAFNKHKRVSRENIIAAIEGAEHIGKWPENEEEIEQALSNLKYRRKQIGVIRKIFKASLSEKGNKYFRTKRKI